MCFPRLSPMYGNYAPFLPVADSLDQRPSPPSTATDPAHNKTPSTPLHFLPRRLRLPAPTVIAEQLACHTPAAGPRPREGLSRAAKRQGCLQAWLSRHQQVHSGFLETIPDF